MIVIVAQLSQAQIAAAKATYENMHGDMQNHVASKKPPKNAEKLDVSARIRSASFGHKTWLHIAPDGSEFWVEFGRSTNTPGGLFGPFPVTAKGEPPAKGGPPAKGEPPAEPPMPPRPEPPSK